MPAHAIVDETGIHFRLSGWAGTLSFARRLDFEPAEVLSAEFLDWVDVRKRFGSRLRSAHLPRQRAGGFFLVKRERLRLVWVWLHRGEPALVLSTTRRRPGEVAFTRALVEVQPGGEWFTQRVR
ncbi:MAG: hypothetical protein RL219_872 [Actinomycetota bacterium]|jgi:hypothetical protein